MKNLIIFLFVVAATSVNQAQEVNQLEAVNLGFAPHNTQIIKTPDGFKLYIDKVSSREFTKDPIGFMYENLDIKNFIEALQDENYYNYVVSLRANSGSMTATFDKIGNLVSTRQNFKNVLLPYHMRQSLFKNHKGWTMTKNKYLARTKGEVITNQVYRITLQNGKRKQKVKIEVNNKDTSIASN